MVCPRNCACRPRLSLSLSRSFHILGRRMRPSRCCGNIAAEELKRQEPAPDANVFEASFHSRSPGPVGDERWKEAEALECGLLEAGLLHRLEDGLRPHV